MSADVIGSDNPMTAAGRATFDVVVDMIVPASADGRKPSAADVGVLDFIRARVPEDVPAIAREIDRLDSAARDGHGAGFTELDSGARQAVVDAMRADDPAFLRTLAMHTVTCYLP